jgi:hypothetical protein
MPAAAGAFRDKQIQFRDLEAWTSHQQYLNERVAPRTDGGLPILPEPISIGGRTDYDHYQFDGFTVRNLEFNSFRGPYPIPGFALIDPTVLSRLQNRHSETQPSRFFLNHVIHPLALAQARIRAYSGAEHTSPHSQNILFMVNEDGTLKDQVRLRDLDYYIDDPIWELWKNHSPSMPHTSEAQLISPLPSPHTFAFLHGIPIERLPTWLDNVTMQNWVRSYFQTFRNEFARITHTQPGNLDLLRTHYNRTTSLPAQDARSYSPRSEAAPNIFYDRIPVQTTEGESQVRAWLHTFLTACRTPLDRVTRFLQRTQR